jgi:hypothetical protein
MVGAPQGAMRITSQIWQVVFASQTLQVFCLALRKKAQYVVVKELVYEPPRSTTQVTKQPSSNVLKEIATILVPSMVVFFSTP